MTECSEENCLYEIIILYLLTYSILSRLVLGFILFVALGILLNYTFMVTFYLCFVISILKLPNDALGFARVEFTNAMEMCK